MATRRWYFKIIKTVALFAIVYGLDNNNKNNNYRNDPFSQRPSTHHSLDPPDNFLDHGPMEQFDNLHLPKNGEFVINEHDSNSMNHKISSHPDQKIRVVRNANDNLKQFLDRTTILARIANGIALQTGLINGLIPIDDAIGELLNFGSFKISDFVNFQPEKINALTETIKGMPEAMAVDNEIERLERQMIAWEQIAMRSESLEEIQNFPDRKPYFTRIQEFLDNYDADSVSTVTILLYQISETLNEIGNIKIDPAKTADEKKNDFVKFLNLFAKFSEIKKAFEKAKNLNPKIFSFDDLEDMSVLKPVETLLEIRIMRDMLKDTGTVDQMEKIRKNLERLMKLPEISKAAQNDFIILKGLIQTRLFPHKAHRKYTNGFFNGVSDVKLLPDSLHDAWMVKIFNGTLQKLVNGLTPLIRTNAKIDGLHNELKSITTSEIVGSFKALDTILSMAKNLSKSLANYENVLEEFKMCNTLAGFDETGVYNARFPVERSRVTWLYYTTLRDSSILDSTTHPITDEMESFKEFLNFTDPDNLMKSREELPDIHKKMMASGRLEKLKNSIKNLDDRTLNPISLRNYAKETVKRQNDIDIYLDSDNALNEYKAHKCVRDVSKKYDKGPHALMLIRQIRLLNIRMIDNVQTVISTISKVSKTFSTFNSFLEDMKKEVNKEAKDLSEMTDLLKVSQTIGQTANSLQNAYRLKELEPFFLQLGNIGHVVYNQIVYTFVADKLELEQQWGDHKKDMAQLENALKHIKAFNAKLDSSNVTTIVDYGVVLKYLDTVTDVSINTEVKSKVLGIYVDKALSVKTPADDRIAEQLKTSKKTVDKISALDLQFSSYKSQFQQTPSAFKTLQDFVTQFLMKKDVVDGFDEKDEGDSTLLISLLSVFGGLALVALIVALIGKKRGWYKKKVVKPQPVPEPLPPVYVTLDGKTRAPQHLIIVWLGNQIFKTNLDAFNCHESIIRMMMVEDAKRINTSMYPLSIRKHRVPTIFCNPATALTNLAKQRIYIHANRIITKNGKIFIATQTPMLKTSEHDDTTEEFWMMAMLEESDKIVMISSQSTDNERMTYFLATPGDEKTCGRFIVRTRDFCDFLPGKYSGSVFKRVVEVRDTTEKLPTRQYTHFQFPIWDDETIPLNGHEPAFAVLRDVLQSDKPIIVHCLTGTGRTMSFIGLEYIAREIEYDTNMTFSTAMAKLNEQRWFGFQTTRQSLWVHSGVVGRIAENIDIRYSSYPEMLEMLDEVAYKRNGIPAIDNRNVKF